MLTAFPTLEDLYGLFPESQDRPEGVEVPAATVPEPYHRLLVHHKHMTLTVEEFYHSPVDVQVLECRRNGNDYSRKILLKARTTGQVVQFGLVRINLGVCPEAVRNEIVAGQIPLGRILIEHNMLRRIKPLAFLHITLRPEMADWFGVPAAAKTYGRVGVIYTGEQPAVEVLEILAPIS